MHAPTRLGLTAVLAASLGATVIVAQASPSLVAATSTSAVLSLPAGPVPVGVPYGIGKVLNLNGIGYNMAPSWTSMLGRPPLGFDGVEFQDIDITRGVPVWAIRLTAIDPASRVGWFRPGYAPRGVTTSGSYPGLATTTGGLVAAGLSSTFGNSVPVTAYNSGARFGPAFTWNPQGQPTVATNQGVGGQFIFQGHDVAANTDRSARLYPGYPQVPLADNTYGVGKGTGWIATADSHGSVCYRTAAVSTPTTLRARICSQTLPMLSDDGTKAVVVQGNHVRLYDTRTGAQINATNAPTLPAADATHSYGLITWQGASSYLVNVRDGNTLAILRCNALSRFCTRAVTSSVRTGVTRIVS